MPVARDILALSAGTHPARLIPWDELYAGLGAEVEAGNVRVSGGLHGHYLYTYTPSCQFDHKWNRINMLSRGLILDVRRQRVIATPFPKFFNYGEIDTLPDEPFVVTEKLDGSLGIVYYEPEHFRWKVATKGSLDSEQAQWAQHRMITHMDLWGALEKYATYLVEIIYPENRIVVDYEGARRLVLLGAYHENGSEFDRAELERLVSKFPLFELVREWKFDSLDDVLRQAENLPINREGFVIRFQSGLRVKIKGAEYCRLHKLIAGITPNRIWEMMKNGDDMEAARRSLPFSFRKDFDRIRAALLEQFYSVLDQAEFWHKSLLNETDTECGKRLQETDDEIAKTLVFPCRKWDLLNDAHVGGSRSRNSVFSFFKPKGNDLVGYEPTSAMNRVQESVL